MHGSRWRCRRGAKAGVSKDVGSREGTGERRTRLPEASFWTAENVYASPLACWENHMYLGVPRGESSVSRYGSWGFWGIEKRL